MKTLYALFAALTLLAGCCCTPRDSAGTTTPPAVTPPAAAAPASPDTCGIARFQSLIGTPASQIDRSTLPPRARIITPDSMVTQDFSAERLNIMTGTDGRVSSLRCF